MDAEIRPASLDDLDGVADIWNRIIRDTTITFTTEEKTVDGLSAWLETARMEGRDMLVAARGGEVLGFANWFQFRGGPGYADTMELTIHLAEHARGKGIGRRLVEALAAKAARAGVHSLWAGCGGENPGAVAFHERCGFERIATLPEVGRKFGRRHDLVLLRRLLDTSR
ncbi:MAG: GNAT family N-acetyltransferase [Rubricella sp.]